jgi:glutamyl-tRNA reductase
VLNRLFQKSFQAVKEIRTRTSIGRGATSVGSVAVELAEKIFRHDLSKQTVIIIGAGQMGEACVRHLAKKGAQSILVSNRSFDRAVDLAGEFGGRGGAVRAVPQRDGRCRHRRRFDGLPEDIAASRGGGNHHGREAESAVVPHRHFRAAQH